MSGDPSPSRRRSSTGRSSRAPIASHAGAIRKAICGPSSGDPNRLAASMTSPPITGDDAVGRGRDVGDAHVPTGQSLRDDVGHERPVDREEAATADADEDGAHGQDRRRGERRDRHAGALARQQRRYRLRPSAAIVGRPGSCQGRAPRRRLVPRIHRPGRPGRSSPARARGRAPAARSGRRYRRG